MTSYVALLRAVNVGGRNIVRSSDLRAWLAKLGLRDPRVLLQTGNIVFRDKRSGTTLERSLRAAVEKDLGLATDFFVRSAAEWDALIAGNPFRNEARDDPARTLLMVLDAAPARDVVAQLQDRFRATERIAAGERALYLVYPSGAGTSKLTGALIERMLGVRGTARNWNTVLKLREAMAST